MTVLNPSGKPTSKYTFMFDKVQTEISVILKMAWVSFTKVVVCDLPFTMSSVVVVSPVNPVPLMTTVQYKLTSSHSVTISVTVGTAPMYVQLQVSFGTHNASSDVFKKVTTFPD
jgi:hypothetical protein